MAYGDGKEAATDRASPYATQPPVYHGPVRGGNVYVPANRSTTEATWEVQPSTQRSNGNTNGRRSRRRLCVNRKSCPSTRQINPDPNRHRRERGTAYFNPANKPISQPTPRGISTSSYPANAANKPISQPPPQGMSTSSYPANAASEPSTEIAPAQFQQHRRIQGSDQWAGSDYQIFRSYRSEWHDRDWWRSHYSRIVFGVGGWYYWNAGYWCPGVGLRSGGTLFLRRPDLRL